MSRQELIEALATETVRDLQEHAALTSSDDDCIITALDLYESGTEDVDFSTTFTVYTELDSQIRKILSVVCL